MEIVKNKTIVTDPQSQPASAEKAEMSSKDAEKSAGANGEQEKPWKNFLCWGAAYTQSIHMDGAVHAKQV